MDTFHRLHTLPIDDAKQKLGKSKEIQMGRYLKKTLLIIEYFFFLVCDTMGTVMDKITPNEKEET